MTKPRRPPIVRSRRGRKVVSDKLRRPSPPLTDAAVSRENAEWLEIFPFGVVFGMSQERPVLLMKDASQVETLPVWLNPIEAGMAMSDKAAVPGTPHAVTRKILEGLNVKVERCSFVELVGHHQYVELEISGNAALTQIRCRADEAISLCMALTTKFFTTREFMRRCRDVDAELLGLGQGMQLDPEIGSKNHPYVM